MAFWQTRHGAPVCYDALEREGCIDGLAGAGRAVMGQ